MKQSDLSEQKFNAIFTYAPLGLAEIKEDGRITMLNLAGQTLLHPVCEFYELDTENLYPILDKIFPGMTERIKSYREPGGQIIYNELHKFKLPPPNDQVEKHIQFSVSKMFEDCIIVGFDDQTAKYQEEKAMQQVKLDNAVAQGKFEIASEVLHDIGNAVVGFGSYLTRINRAMELDNVKNLENTALFLKSQQDALATALGEQKAGALLNLIEGIAKSEKDSQAEIRRAVTEQLSIVSHIQEILNIQRHYITGRGTPERKPVSLKEIIHDCQSMLFASYDKKGIAFSINAPAEVPLIKGDRTKLMQVILNLLKNSIEAIDLDAPKKNISIELLPKDELLELTIMDSGKGFDAATATHIFERGFTTKNTGTGLGLYNCKSIIESHAGSIEVSSNGPGLGATTLIRFSY
ncbi:signal transduction histidine kinase [Pedobacter africanus]|uniref:Signal transduction histidine kinase n=1 Tax=Pedobacter africanus TaxID=151894 RepID=A0ACC6KU39_9SPHI|nr:HAMP domain-containing sensor histidine kinase [Pedobacter africanus]MDR6782726.1 signal transduction histidine kinase [Pedobacter africanus]